MEAAGGDTDRVTVGQQERLVRRDEVGKPPTFRIGEDRIRFDGHVEVGVKMAEAICHRLRMSNDDTAQIVALVNNHMRFGDAPRMKESTLKRFFRLPKFEERR